MKYFTKDHEWVQVEEDLAKIGITDHAQSELGDIVFVDLPSVGDKFKAGEEAAVVESVKAAGEVNAPVGGEVVAVNEGLHEEPGRINSDAQGDGWMYQVRMNDASQLDDLMDEQTYRDYLVA